jgi:hypothetical protein
LEFENSQINSRLLELKHPRVYYKLDSIKKSFMRLFLNITLFALLFAACSGPTERVTTAPVTIPLTADFPLYEGSNTAIGEWTIDWNAMVSDQSISAEQLKEAKVAKVIVDIADADYAGLMDQITLQLTTANSEMQKVAFLNPVQMDATSFELQIATEQNELAEMFKEDKLVLVADINTVEDLEDDFILNIAITFEFEVKP